MSTNNQNLGNQRSDRQDKNGQQSLKNDQQQKNKNLDKNNQEQDKDLDRSSATRARQSDTTAAEAPQRSKQSGAMNQDRDEDMMDQGRNTVSKNNQPKERTQQSDQKGIHKEGQGKTQR